MSVDGRRRKGQSRRSHQACRQPFRRAPDWLALAEYETSTFVYIRAAQRPPWPPDTCAAQHTCPPGRTSRRNTGTVWRAVPGGAAITHLPRTAGAVSGRRVAGVGEFREAPQAHEDGWWDGVAIAHPPAQSTSENANRRSCAPLWHAG
jgi:hypothetical protein